MTFVSATPDQGICNEFAGIVECFLGSLESGDFTQIEILVQPTVIGAIVNIAQVQGAEFDPLSSNNISTQTTTVRVRPVDPPDPPDPGDPSGADLFVLKFGTPNPIVVGQDISYMVFVGNLGTINATNVILTDALPSSTQFISASPSQGTCFELNGIVTCELGNIADGGIQLAAVVEIVVRTNATVTISNIAQVIGNENDPNTSNNIQIVMVEVIGSDIPNPTPTPTPNPTDTGSKSSSCCTVAQEDSTNADLLGLILYALIPGAIIARRVRKKRCSQ